MPRNREQLRHNRLSQRKKRKAKKRKVPPLITRITKAKFLRAMRETGGLKTRIAANLGVSWARVNDRLTKKKGWEDVRLAWIAECEAVGDLAEETIRDAMTQRLDIGTASLNARWYLNHRHRNRGYGSPDSKVIIEGGDNPLQVVQTVVDVDTLNLSLEVRKAMLAAIEAKEDGDEEEEDE